MKRIDLLKRSARNSRSHKGRVILTSLAIAVGAFTITLGLALSAGVKTYLDDMLSSNFDKQSIMIDAEGGSIVGFGGMDSDFIEYDPNIKELFGQSRKFLTSSDIKKIEALPELDFVDPYVQLTADYFTVEGNDKKWTNSFLGNSINQFPRGIKITTVAGEMPKLKDPLPDTDAVINEKIASKVNMSAQDLVGKKLILHIINKLDPTKEDTYSFNIVAVAKNTITEQQITALSISNDMMLKIFNDQKILLGQKVDDSYPLTIARIKDQYKVTDVADKIKSIGFQATTAEDIQKNLFKFASVIQIVIIFFGSLAILASVFGIVNTIYISVMERINQIGLMKALGMHSKDVSRLFRYEAGWIGFIGSFTGVVLAYIAGLGLNPLISDKLNLEAGQYLLKFNIIPALILMAVLIFIAIIAGFFPSRKAAKLDPIKALYN